MKKDLHLKRVLRTTLIVLLLSGVGIGKGFSQVTIGNLIYWLYDYTAGVAGHKNGASATGSLVIPSYVTYTDEYGNTNTYIVTEIGSTAFEYCSGLTGNLVIPNTITSIGDGAFNGCSGFNGSLTLPNSLTLIGNYSFRNCSGFKGDLVIPDSVVEIGNSAFEYCSGFNGSLILSNSLAWIPYSAFNGCSGFRGDLVIPNSVEYIESYAFNNCSGFSGSLIIGNSVTTIVADDGNMSRTFGGCSGFKSVTIPQSLTSIVGADTFRDCTGLTAVYYTGTIAQWCKIYFYNIISNPLRYAHNLYVNNHLVTDLAIPEGVTEIKNFAFTDATCLTSLTLPNSLKTIGIDAFWACSNLSGNLIVPNSVIIIGVNAFGCCSGFIGDLIIPNSVTNIGNGAFWNCIGFDGTLTLPNSLTSISVGVFCGCCHLKGNLVIPSSVTKIGCAAFKDCSGFTKTLFMPANCTNIEDQYFNFINDWADAPPFEGCSGALVVGENMQDIPAYLFKNAAFDEITLNNTVNSIEEEAFAGCNSLRTINCWNETPPMLGVDAFADVDYDDVIVHVPCGKALAYQTFGGWNEFSHYDQFLATWLLNVSSDEPEHCETEIVQLPMCESGEAIVRARPEKGYRFLGWYENDDRVSQDTLYTFYLDASRELVAKVRKNTDQEEYQDIHASIYPNPSSGKVTVKATDLKRINISNMMGQCIYDRLANGNEFDFDFSNYEVGVYIVRIETTSGMTTKQVVVTK